MIWQCALIQQFTDMFFAHVQDRGELFDTNKFFVVHLLLRWDVQPVHVKWRKSGSKTFEENVIIIGIEVKRQVAQHKYILAHCQGGYKL